MNSVSRFGVKPVRTVGSEQTFEPQPERPFHTIRLEDDRRRSSLSQHALVKQPGIIGDGCRQTKVMHRKQHGGSIVGGGPKQAKQDGCVPRIKWGCGFIEHQHSTGLMLMQ